MFVKINEKEEVFVKIRTFDAQWQGLGDVWNDYGKDFKSINDAKAFIEEEKKLSPVQKFRVIENTKIKRVIK